MLVYFLVGCLVLATEGSSKDYHLQENSDIHHCQLVINLVAAEFRKRFYKDYKSLSDQ